LLSYWVVDCVGSPSACAAIANTLCCCELTSLVIGSA
jgi:hypothetical protein